MEVLRAQPDWTHTAVKADEADIERRKLSAAGKLHLSREFQPRTGPVGRMLLDSALERCKASKDAPAMMSDALLSQQVAEEQPSARAR